MYWLLLLATSIRNTIAFFKILIAIFLSSKAKPRKKTGELQVLKLVSKLKTKHKAGKKKAPYLKNYFLCKKIYSTEYFILKISQKYIVKMSYFITTKNVFYELFSQTFKCSNVFKRKKYSDFLYIVMSLVVFILKSKANSKKIIESFKKSDHNTKIHFLQKCSNVLWKTRRISLRCKP